MLRFWVLLLAIVGSVSASLSQFIQHPFGFGSDSVDFTQWHPPTGSDVRSPCPGLNALANHGLLPRDGRNISIPLLTNALNLGLHVGPDFAKVIGNLAIRGARPPGSTSFDLDDLAQHGTVEHDGSISRHDAKMGDNKDFDQGLFEDWLRVATPNHEKTITLEAAARARWYRVKTSNATNPEFHYNQKEAALSYGETALFISTMGHPIFGNPPTHFVEILFREERLPWIEGWRPPHAETNLLTLPTMIFRIKGANPAEATAAEAGGMVSTLLDVMFRKEVPPLLPCWKGGC